MQYHFSANLGDSKNSYPSAGTQSNYFAPLARNTKPFNNQMEVSSARRRDLPYKIINFAKLFQNLPSIDRKHSRRNSFS